MRRKRIGIIIAFIMLAAVALAACGNKEGESEKEKTEANSGKNEKENEGEKDNDSEDNDGGSSLSGAVSKAQIQEAINSIFSELGVTNFPVPDADSYTFNEETEGFFTGYFELKGVNIDNDAYLQQILDSCPQMKKGKMSLTGTAIGVPAGMELLGFNVSVMDGELTLWLSHYEKCFTKAYIAEMEAKMPKIIPGTNALSAMPEQFTAKLVKYGTDYITLVRDGENWHVDIVSKNDDQTFKSRYKRAIVSQPDGSMLVYTASSTKENKEPVFGKGEDYSYEELEGFLSDYFSPDGNRPSFSSYMQMSKDFEEGTTFMGAFSGGSLSSSLQKTGTKQIGAITCDVLSSEGLWSYSEIWMDPATGILFFYQSASSTLDDGTPRWDVQWNVTDFQYSADTSLFPQ